MVISKWLSAQEWTIDRTAHNKKIYTVINRITVYKSRTSDKNGASCNDTDAKPISTCRNEHYCTSLTSTQEASGIPPHSNGRDPKEW